MLIELLVTLVLLTGSNVTIQYKNTPELVNYSNYAAFVQCVNKQNDQFIMPCWNKQFRIVFNVKPSVETQVHEFSHVYDGMDDGLMNGSPGHPFIEGRYNKGDYCLTNMAEWYACEVIRTGRLR